MCPKVASNEPLFGLQAHQQGQGPPFQLNTVAKVVPKGVPGGEMDLFSPLAKLKIASRYVTCYISWNFHPPNGGLSSKFILYIGTQSYVRVYTIKLLP